MYIIESIHRSESSVRIAVATPRELFATIWMIDHSDQVVVWRIEGHVPAEFGWGMKGWNKYSEQFTSEHYKQST